MRFEITAIKLDQILRQSFHICQGPNCVPNKQADLSSWIFQYSPNHDASWSQIVIPTRNH